MSRFFKILKDCRVVTVDLFRMIRGTCQFSLYFLSIAVVLSAVIGFFRWKVFGGWVQSLANNSADSFEVTQILLAAVAATLLLGLAIEKMTGWVDKKTVQFYVPFFASIRERIGMSSFQVGSKEEDMLARAEDGEFWLRYFIPSMVSILSIALNLCVGGAIIVWNVPLIGLCLVASFVMALVIELYAANKIVAKERDLRPLLSESTTTKNHFRYKEQMKAILSLGMGKPLIGHLTELAEKIYVPQRWQAVRLLPLHLVSFVALVVAYAASFYFLREKALGGMPIGQISFLAVTAITLGMNLKQIVDVLSKQVQGADKVVDLLTFLKVEEQVAFIMDEGMPPVTEGASAFGDSGAVDVVIKDLSFGYRPGKLIFDGFNLTIPAGEVTYLVGRNGVGKTTLFSLLNQLYDCARGMVMINGVDVRSVHPALLRQIVLVASQGTLALRYTPRQSFGFVGGVRHDPKEALVWKALRCATLDQKVREFEQGLDEPLAVYHGAKHDFSGGQHKKFDLALFFYGALSGKVRLAVLDEPFIGIDPESAFSIMEEIYKLECTTVISMHEIERIPADANVIFLGKGDDGRVRAWQGEHQKLLASVGQYRSYCAREKERTFPSRRGVVA